eukprot:TRINITY_DN34_c3_g2_i1.p1 TRINITY_DN34_c3_g2~~TRINITY_DN34_c3_g2_i1.p1  ORF type:complete len:350 (+),score=101.70 TRINITY_DN34_c3_g2_i1:136-1050(+)
MAMLDQSLDEIIAQRQAQRGKGTNRGASESRGGGGGSGSGKGRRNQGGRQAGGRQRGLPASGIQQGLGLLGGLGQMPLVLLPQQALAGMPQGALLQQLMGLGALQGLAAPPRAGPYPRAQQQQLQQLQQQRLGNFAAGGDESPAARAVYASQLPTGMSEAQALKLMQTSGKVEKLHVFFDATGAPQGSLVCVYRSVNEARRGIQQLNGQTLLGQRIAVTTVPPAILPYAGLTAAPTPLPLSVGGAPPRFNGLSGPTAAPRRGTNRGKGQQQQGRKGGGAPRARDKRTKSELDAELDAFVALGTD